MTPLQTLALFVFGILLTLIGLAWLVGPWAFIVAGLVAIGVALLTPEKESRGEPAGKDAPPRR